MVDDGCFMTSNSSQWFQGPLLGIMMREMDTEKRLTCCLHILKHRKGTNNTYSLSVYVCEALDKGEVHHLKCVLNKSSQNVEEKISAMTVPRMLRCQA